MPYLLAARASEGEFLIGLAFIGIFVFVAVVSAALRGPANYDVRLRGGAPYCPVCNRQVSYRRDHCRSCGYTFISYGSSSPARDTPFIDSHSRAIGGWIVAFLGILFRLPFVLADELVAFTRAKIWPSICHAYSFRWFGSLPEWAQPVVLGLLLPALPVLAFIAIRYFVTR